VSQVSDKSCFLEWEHVQEDGGIPIYNYDVFMREQGSQWTKVNKDMVFSNFFWINDQLKPGGNYEFKIEATNEAGLTSNSGVSSEPIAAPKSFGKFLKLF
jgi:hypothetical protein